jgi:outer membrane receptor for ferrienterochelin and colicin
MMRRTAPILTLAASLFVASPAFGQDGEEVVLPPIVTEDEPVEDDSDSTTEQVDRVDDETLDRRKSWRLDEALAWLTGGQPVDDTSTRTGLIVEGLPASQLEVLSNGLPVGRTTGGPNGPAIDGSAQSVGGQNIEGLELHRGLGPLGTGPASGMVVLIDEREFPQGTAASARLSGQSAPMQLDEPLYTQVNGSAAAHHAFGSGWSFQLDGGVDSRRAVDVNEDGVEDLPDRRLYRGQIGVNWRQRADEGLRLRASYDDNGTNAPIGSTSQLQDVVRTRRTQLSARGRWRPAELWTVEHKSQFDLYEHRFSKRVLSSNYLRLKADTTQFRTIHDVSATRVTGLHELGAELYGSLERIERTGETGALPAVDRGHVGVSAADTWVPSKSVELRTRLWGDWHSDFGAGFMGDVSVGWQALDALLLRASAARTRRLPTAEELFLFFDHSEVGYQISGNPDLEPERMWSFRAGTKLGRDSWPARVEFDGFYHRLDRLITTVDTDAPEAAVPVFTYTNLSKAHTAGLTTRIVAEALVGELDVRASHSYLPLARDLETDERLDFRARHQATLELMYGWLDDDLRAWVDVRTRSQLEVPPDSPTAPAYALLGVGGRWQAADDWALDLDVDNLLDQTNATWGPKPGLSAMISVSYNYQTTTHSR